MTRCRLPQDSIPVNDTAGSDAFIFSSIVEPVEEGLAELESEIVGVTEIDLDTRRDIIRAVESAAGNVIADSFLAIAQALSGEFGTNSPQVSSTYTHTRVYICAQNDNSR